MRKWNVPFFNFFSASSILNLSAWFMHQIRARQLNCENFQWFWKFSSGTKNGALNKSVTFHIKSYKGYKVHIRSHKGYRTYQIVQRIAQRVKESVPRSDIFYCRVFSNFVKLSIPFQGCSYPNSIWNLQFCKLKKFLFSLFPLLIP